MKKVLISIAAVIIALSLICSCSNSTIKKDVISTTAETKQIKAGTYNIHIGKGMDKVLDLNRIAKIITDNNADIIGLQEIDKNTTRSGNINQFEELKKLTGMNGVFGKSIDFQGGEYGIGILTKYKIIESKHFPMPEGKESERRSFIAVLVETKTGFKFWFINTHLGLVAEDRKDQIAAINDFSKQCKEPLLFVGDLNNEPDFTDAAFKMLLANFDDAFMTSAEGKPLQAEAQKINYLTFPSDKPDRKIDYIMMRKNEGWQKLDAYIPNTQASDHLPLFAVITNSNF